VPEIAITYQLVRRFDSRFGNKIAVLHSGLTPAQRREEWLRIRSGEARLVIGARSAIFAPASGLRLIVVDEENDSSYKQGEYPYYNARDVATVLGKFTGAAVVLGSATPSFETYYNAANGKYSVSRLTSRIDDRPMPSVKFIQEKEDSQPIPPAVLEKLSENIGRKEQSLVFINRRGAATCAKCKVCKEVVRCPNCSISLTYHSSGSKLLCHYCAYELPVRQKCPTCKAEALYSFKGAGTQKMESYLKEMFPKASVARLDSDTADTRGEAFAILEKFEKGEVDILVGTQITAKGHDFPNLTFTAIIGADDILSFPDFRSPERAFSLIMQSAGRTGRGTKPGEVMITGSAEGEAILCAVNHDYDSFYKIELGNRKKTGFPPFSRLVGIMFESTSQQRLEKGMSALMKKMPRMAGGVMALGPVPALVYKIRNRFRWKMLLKGTHGGALRAAALSVEKAVETGISVSIDVDTAGFI
jgi:primosomal protein N' (replication factor Y)